MSHAPVFISYARADGLVPAQGLFDELKRRGIEAFLDRQRLCEDEPNPPPPIVDALAASRVAVLLVTHTYGQRPYCRYEAGLAVDHYLRGRSMLLASAIGTNATLPLLPNLLPCPDSNPVGWLAGKVEALLAAPLASSGRSPVLRPWWIVTPSSSALDGVELEVAGSLSARAKRVREVAIRWSELGWDPIHFRLKVQPGDTLDAIRKGVLSFPAAVKPLLSLGRDATILLPQALALRDSSSCRVELVQPAFDALALEDRARVDVVRFAASQVISPSDEWDAAVRIRKRAWNGPTILLDNVEDAETLRRVRSFCGLHPRLAVSGPAELIRAGAQSSPFHPLSGIAPCL